HVRGHVHVHLHLQPDTPPAGSGSPSPPAPGDVSRGARWTGLARAPSLLSTPPLAALHSMTEMKTPCTRPYPLSSPALSASPTAAAATATSPNPGGISSSSSSCTSSCSPGIVKATSGMGSPRQHKLESPAGSPSNLLLLRRRLRPTDSTSARGAAAAVAAAAAARYPKPLADLPGRTPIFWPGVLQSPALEGRPLPHAPPHGKRKTHEAHILWTADICPGKDF
ncbi:hypothetical protein CRUP_010458, partial [Coryphaenoides rupestris]